MGAMFRRGVTRFLVADLPRGLFSHRRRTRSRPGGVLAALDCILLLVGPAGGGAGGIHTAGTPRALGEDGVPRPEGAPDGQGGAVALPDGSEEPAGNARTAGIVLLAAAAVAVMLTGALTNRRRRSRQLT